MHTVKYKLLCFLPTPRQVWNSDYLQIIQYNKRLDVDLQSIANLIADNNYISVLIIYYQSINKYWLTKSTALSYVIQNRLIQIDKLIKLSYDNYSHFPTPNFCHFYGQYTLLYWFVTLYSCYITRKYFERYVWHMFL